MREFSSAAHRLLIGQAHAGGGMQSVQLTRATLALLIIAVMVGGILLGTTFAGMAAPDSTAAPTATTAPPSSADPSLPARDVDGRDLDRLPRFPGSVRTEYAVSRDARFRLTTLEFVADATVEDARLFYQGVIEEHGWERADVQLGGGEWTYILVDGRTEALVEIELTNGLAEIDVQVSEPLDSPTREPVVAPTSEPTPAPTPAPTARPAAPPPPAPPGDDDGDDGDDDDGDGEGSDDGGSDG